LTIEEKSKSKVGSVNELEDCLFADDATLGSITAELVTRIINSRIPNVFPDLGLKLDEIIFQ
jgi:hypothetical protein